MGEPRGVLGTVLSRLSMSFLAFVLEPFRHLFVYTIAHNTQRKKARIQSEPASLLVFYLLWRLSVEIAASHFTSNAIAVSSGTWWVELMPFMIATTEIASLSVTR